MRPNSRRQSGQDTIFSGRDQRTKTLSIVAFDNEDDDACYDDSYPGIVVKLQEIISNFPEEGDPRMLRRWLLLSGPPNAKSAASAASNNGCPTVWYPSRRWRYEP